MTDRLRERKEYHQKYAAEHDRKAYFARYRAENPSKKAQYSRTYHLKKHYGLTVEAYDELVKLQGGACAICFLVVPKLVVDHCHATGKRRALLCPNCNTAIGLLVDSSLNCQRASEYLQTHAGKRSEDSGV